MYNIHKINSSQKILEVNEKLIRDIRRHNEYFQSKGFTQFNSNIFSSHQPYKFHGDLISIFTTDAVKAMEQKSLDATLVHISGNFKLSKAPLSGAGLIKVEETQFDFYKLTNNSLGLVHSFIRNSNSEKKKTFEIDPQATYVLSKYHKLILDKLAA
jgi:hypothetical protein